MLDWKTDDVTSGTRDVNAQVRLRAVQVRMDLGNNHSPLGCTIVAKNAGKASLHQFISLAVILEYTLTSTSHHRTEPSLSETSPRNFPTQLGWLQIKLTCSSSSSYLDSGNFLLACVVAGEFLGRPSFGDRRSWKNKWQKKLRGLPQAAQAHYLWVRASEVIWLKAWRSLTWHR